MLPTEMPPAGQSTRWEMSLRKSDLTDDGLF
jgi:hypothetical protein